MGPIQITLREFFANDQKGVIEKLKFSDGGALDLTVPFPFMTPGTEAAESIAGTSFPDTIIGMGGNDTLDGGAGDDVYLFNPGDGQDVIYSKDGSDKILFGDGIKNEDIYFSLSGEDLVIKIGKTTDQITLQKYLPLYSAYYRSVKKLEFSEGPAYDLTAGLRFH